MQMKILKRGEVETKEERDVRGMGEGAVEGSCAGIGQIEKRGADAFCWGEEKGRRGGNARRQSLEIMKSTCAPVVLS